MAEEKPCQTLQVTTALVHEGRVVIHFHAEPLDRQDRQLAESEMVIVGDAETDQ